MMQDAPFEIRLARDEDRSAIRRVHESAFETDGEAKLVDALRADGSIVISLVAGIGGAVVGSVVYSRLLADGENVGATALAPVAVVPSRQRKGIGGALIGEAHRRLAAMNERLVIVLGDPAYYRRFGFSVEAARRFRTPYDGPYLMALDIAAAGAQIAGRITYPPAFAALS